MAESFGDPGNPATGVNPSWRDVAAANADIIEGWRFCATLHLGTPLRVLLMHGHFIEGATADLPQVGTPAEGTWVPQTRSLKEYLKQFGVNIRGFSEGTMASCIGQVPASGGDLLPFLIEYQRIDEGPGTEDDKAMKFDALVADPRWASVRRAAPADHVGQLAFERLVDAIGGDWPIARKLHGAGLRTADEVRAQSDASLRAIPGIGPKRLAAIRAGLAAAPATTTAVH